MPSVEEDLFSRLTADSAVTTIVGTRVFPYGKLTDLQLPALIYQRISTVPTRGLQGPHGLEAVRVQVTAWADTYSEMISLASAVKTALDGKENTMFENQVDRFDKDLHKNYSVLDFTIAHAP